MKKDYKWHFVEDNDYPEIKEETDEDGYKFYRSDTILLYGVKYFTPDHVDQNDHYMEYSLGSCYRTGHGELHFYSQFGLQDIKAWRYIDLTRPRRKKVNNEKEKD